MKQLYFLLLNFIILTGLLQAQTTGSLKVVKTFHIASSGGWDYLAVGPGNKLYVSHGTQVNILDKNTGDSVGIIENTSGVHGIAFDEAGGKGYTSNGRLSNVTVFDLKSSKILGQIATGENPDAIMFDSFSKKIITCNGRSKDLSVIDPESQKVVATIPVGGKPETAVSDNSGKWFVNVEDKNEIVQVNSKTFLVENHWPLSPAEGPTGLAIDIGTNRLFAGCDKKLVIINSKDGKVINSLPIGDGCDGVVFDNASKYIFTANGEGTITIIKEQSPDIFVVTANVPTKKSARTITLDPSTHTLYLPAADLEAQSPGSQGRARPLPGTFQILVVK